MTKSNKLETMPINQLIRNVSLPLMVSMLVQSLYNIVDSIFVSSISKEALISTSIAYPMQMLMLSFAIGIGVGLNALLSKTLGSKNFIKAQKIVQTSYFQAIISWLCFIILSLFAQPFVSLFTNNQKIINLGTIYLRICLSGSLGIFASTTGERILQATGNSLISMCCQISGAIINIVLDYIFICHFNLGIQGAALATVISQITSAILTFYMNYQKNYFLMNKLKLSFDFSIAKFIYKIGIPTMIMQMSGSLMIFILNQLLKDTPSFISVFGIYYKTWTFLFMPISGLAQGLLPIIGYNYGAKKYQRMQYALRCTLKIAVSIMTIGMLVFLIFPHILLSPYHLSQIDINIGIIIYRTFAFTLIFTGISVTIGFYFSALGNGLIGMYATLIRQLSPMPFIFIIKSLINLNCIWIIFIISELLSALYCYIHLRKKHLFKNF